MALVKIGCVQLIALMFIPDGGPLSVCVSHSVSGPFTAAGPSWISQIYPGICQRACEGLSMKCWREPNVREESAVAVCTEMSTRTSNTCRWDIYGSTENRVVDGSVSFSELPSSANDARVLWTCSLRYKLPASTSDNYYYVYFGESQDRRRLAFYLNTWPSMTCWYMPDIREWNVAVVCTEMSARTSNTCRWETSGIYTERVEGSGSFSELPTSANDSRVLCNCSLRHKMPSPQTVYYTYIYYVYFGESQDKGRAALALRLYDPGELILKNCPQSVKDGDSVTCACTTQLTGNPPPILSWRGQTTSVLHLSDASVAHQETKYTCEMIWGNRTKTVFYNFTIEGSTENDRVPCNNWQQD